MKAKQVIKIGIDLCMTVLLFVLMAFHYAGLQWHEVTGAAMLVLFILHHILNGSWYRMFRKGKYSAGRILLTAVDAVLLIDMALLMFSGISMSRYVFRFLDIPVSKAWARGIHMTASYTGFLLMGFHIGLHYGMIFGMVKKICPAVKKNAACTWALRVLAALIAGYGVYALFTRKFVDYISQKVMFAFFDYEEPALSFVLDYAAIMGLMIFIAYYLQRFLQWKVRGI
ncbi:MAG: DUF4405 domain-containing protein [Eubacterium sp.]|nr:DUF4405 domain-containing protein [Eubacterium sp.]